MGKCCYGQVFFCKVTCIAFYKNSLQCQLQVASTSILLALPEFHSTHIEDSQPSKTFTATEITDMDTESQYALSDTKS